MSKTPYNYARTHNLRLKMRTQWDHHRARNWLAWFLLSAAVLLGWTSIMTLVLFVAVGGRLAYVLWRWVDAMERRTQWRNSLASSR